MINVGIVRFIKLFKSNANVNIFPYFGLLMWFAFNKELINLFIVVSVLPLLMNVIRLPNSSKKQTNTGY